MRKLSIAVLAAALFVVSPATVHAGSVASAAKKGVAVGTAKVSLFTSTVLAKGGKGTTAVSINSVSSGHVFLKFTGKYPDDITPGNVILQMSAENGNYGVTNGSVATASPTEINVHVYVWSSNDLVNLIDSIFVSLLIGN